MDKTARIETRRFMEVLNMLRTGLTFKEMTEIATILCAFDENTNKLIYFFEFMKPIKLLLDPPEPGEEKEPSSPPSPEAEAFDIVLEKDGKKDFDAYYEEQEKRENAKENKEDVLVNEQRPKEAESKKESEVKEMPEGEEAQVEPDVNVSELNPAWCDGEFTVVVNRCHDCHQHRDYTWHYEEVTFPPL